MNVKVLLLILASVGLSAIAQVTLKLGMSSKRVQDTLVTVGGRLDSALTILTEPMVLIGLGLYGIGALTWLLVLAKLDVSAAYPFLGLGFVITMLLGWLLLGESIGFLRVIGAVLISIGIVLVASTT